LSEIRQTLQSNVTAKTEEVTLLNAQRDKLRVKQAQAQENLTKVNGQMSFNNGRIRELVSHRNPLLIIVT
jgi:hypothetical protein